MARQQIDPKISILKNILLPYLNEAQTQLFNATQIELRKDKYVIRITEGFYENETMWRIIQEFASKNGLRVQRELNAFATLDELDDVLGNVDWLWSNWIPVGFITLVVGDPGTGKSMIALDWLRRVTIGEYFPFCDIKQSPGNTVWVEAENAQQLLRIRANSLKIPKNMVYLPLFGGQLLGQPDLESEEDREKLIELIQNKKPKMLVVDSLGGLNRKGENKVEDVKPIMEFLSAIARDENLSLVLIHHMNKGDGVTAASLSRVRGSSLISAYCRSIVAVEKFGESEVKLTNIKNNLAPQPSPLLLRFEHYDDKDKSIKSIEYDFFRELDKRKSNSDLCAEWVRSYLSNASGPIRVRQLIEAANENGYTRSNLYGAKKKLGNLLRITGTGNTSYWQLSADTDTKSITLIQGSMLKRKMDVFLR